MGGVTVGPDGLLLDGEPLPVFSAEAHAWRIDPADWPRVLDTIAELGFTCVSSYSPWLAHEVERGRFTFEGRLDLPRFWSLAAERGLKVIARPGPNQGAELETSGWPRRVLDDPACQALRSDGRGYLLPTATHQAFMPSYGSRATLAEIAGWYDAIAPLVAEHQWPDGPVVACHVDNEMGFHFQAHPYALDYHPDTLEQWRDYAGADVEPPRDGRDGDLELRTRWIAFREHHLRRSLTTLAEMLRERGVTRVPLLHNDYPRTTTPFDSGALEKQGVVDVAAGDVYATRHGGRFVRDYARHLSGTSRLPWLAEAGAGWLTLPWLLPMAVEGTDAHHGLWRALSGGVRAFNVFMAVERDRWYGSPIAVDGTLQPPAEALGETLVRLRALDWTRLRRRPEVLLVENRELSRRAAAASVAGDLVPPFRQVLPLDARLFSEEGEEAATRRAWSAALDTRGVDWDEASSSSLPDLSPYQLVLVTGRDDLDPAAQAQLGAAEAAGAVVTDVVPEDVPLPLWSCAHEGVDVTGFADDTGRQVVLAVNGSGQEVATRVEGPSPYDVVLAPWGVDAHEVPA